MRASDKDARPRRLRGSRAAPLQFVRRLAAAHKRNAPDLRLAIWLNADADPWAAGLEMLEVCTNVALDLNFRFRPLEFGPRDGVPRLRLILASPMEINLALEMHAAFVRRLFRRLNSGQAVVVWPGAQRDALAQFDRVLRQAPDKGLMR